jgi:class 3 adenylate cyclase
MERRDDALDVRVSDAERERMVARLKGHLADGRLSVDEFSARTGEAYASKTVRDLELCLRDLPQEGRARADADTGARREWRRDVVARFAFPNLTCIGVWALTTGGHGYFWPSWVLLATGIGLTKKLLHGPHRDSGELAPTSTAGISTTTDNTTTTGTTGNGDHDDERVLTTCLFVDIVGSTELATTLGDARWTDVLDQHHRRAHDRVTKWRGQEIFTRGDELVAGFDSATRAVSCARDIRDAARSLGLEIRAGIHAGEVQRRGADVSGIALHIGQRVSALAGAGEILVSSTVKDMATGSGIEFEARGESQLKGVPGNWLLFAVTD